MPGIFGALRPQYKNDMEAAERLMERMILSMSHGADMRIDRFKNDAECLVAGRASLGILNPSDQPVKSTDGNCLVLFHGELHGRNGSENDPEFVLRQYLEKADGCADGLNGIFHFAVIDMRQRKVKLFSDRFGLQPLYYSTSEAGLVFGAEVKAVIQDPEIRRQPDWRSLADFLHYGQILGEKTLFEDVHLLAPGSLLVFDMDTCRASTFAYCPLSELFVQAGAHDPSASLEKVVSLLEIAIRRRGVENKDILGLSLSGGLDSRGLLAGLGGGARGLYTYTLGLAGCADEKLAFKMAKAAGTRHEFIELDQTYIRHFKTMAEEMIRLSDGMYHPHESTEMLALQYFRRAPFKVLLRGHGGEIAKAALAYPVMATPKITSCRSGPEVMGAIFEITNLVMRDIEPEKLLQPEFTAVMKEAPRESLERSCTEAAKNFTPTDVCIYYYIQEHIRRQVVASLDIFRTQLEVRLPYIDADFIGKLLRLPVEWRRSGEVHVALVRRCMPALLKIPNSNTGAPLDAGPLRLFVADKFTSLLKKLSVRGFRHYTEFQKWHREGFRDNSRQIIFSPQTEGRGLYKMDFLKEVFEQHASGQKDYGHLLGTIVGLELWFRQFVDA
jgi:asparagine synthase (glutamine-hydrolysing)